MASVKARRLRMEMTDAERRLWSALRSRRLAGYKFRRQRPIGPFIADFACIEYRLVVEADGGQHADNDADRRRTAWLERHGWRVLRFWNNDILTNASGVAQSVLEALARSPHPPGAARRVPRLAASRLDPARRERGLERAGNR